MILGSADPLFSGGAGRSFEWSLERLDVSVFRVSLSLTFVFAFSSFLIDLFSRSWPQLNN